MSAKEEWNEDIADHLDGLVSRLMDLRAEGNLNRQAQGRVLNGISATRGFNSLQIGKCGERQSNERFVDIL